METQKVEVVKHTPGPWKVNLHAPSGELRIGNDQPQVTIARMGMWLADETSEQQSNANLIAAAPDLLEALEAIWDVWKQQQYPQNSFLVAELTRLKDQVERAISKARESKWKLSTNSLTG